VQPLPLPARHEQVVGERAEQLDVLLDVVDPFPVVLPDGGHLEQAAGLDLGPVVFEFPRPWPRRIRRLSLADLVVDVLDLFKERIAPVREHVLLRPKRQVSSWSQRLPGTLVPHPRVDPVPGRGREHQADRFVRPPILEPSLHHVDVEPSQVPAGRRGELAAQLQARETEPPPGQWQRGLPRGAPHLQQPVTRRQPGPGDQVVEERLGIIGPDPVVCLGRLVKRRPQPLSLSIGPHPGQYRNGT
jgi:hypothetical protein